MILYVNSTSIPTVVGNWIQDANNQDGMYAGWIFGGTGSVSAPNEALFYAQMQ